MKYPKLYIWTRFEPDYTSGLAFAIAPTETAARKMVEKEQGYSVSCWGDLEIRDVHVAVARRVNGGG